MGGEAGEDWLARKESWDLEAGKGDRAYRASKASKVFRAFRGKWDLKEKLGRLGRRGTGGLRESQDLRGQPGQMVLLGNGGKQVCKGRLDLADTTT